MSVTVSLDPKVIDEIVKRVLRVARPERMILFGSAANGEMTSDSDIDLLVVLDDDAPPAMRTLKAGYESRRGYHRAADVIPVREAAYQKRAKIAGTLAYEAAIEGVMVYERA